MGEVGGENARAKRRRRSAAASADLELGRARARPTPFSRQASFAVRGWRVRGREGETSQQIGNLPHVVEVNPM